MEQNWPRAVAAVWQFDGIKDDEAPGESFTTTYGITAFTWADAVRAGIVNKPQRQCTPDDARAILKALYWDKCVCGEWPTGVDLMVFDFAMMAGEGRAYRDAVICLQHAVNVEPDGMVGILTMAAVAKAEPAVLVNDLKQEHLDYLSQLNNWHQFRNGWTRRQDTMQAIALSWLNPPVG